jgi:hypothetical protein
VSNGREVLRRGGYGCYRLVSRFLEKWKNNSRLLIENVILVGSVNVSHSNII